MRTERFEHPCHDCLLGGHKTKVRGSLDAPILVVCKAPTQFMATKGIHMPKDSSAVFQSFMAGAGFQKEDFVFVSSIRCGYDPTEHPAKDRHIIEKHCREWLLRVIDRIKPEVILPLGADAAKAVAGRSVKITKVRGSIQYDRQLETYILPMLDPFMVYSYPQHESTFKADCRTLRSFVDADYDIDAVQNVEHGKYTFVDDLQYLIDDPPEYLSFDLETLGTRWADENGCICTMQFCTEPGKAQMLVWDHPERPIGLRQKHKVRRQLRQILQNPDTSVFGQNLKFDRLWIQRHLGFSFRIDHDTIMLAAINDENMLTKNQDDLVKLYVPEMAGYADAFNQKYDKSRMDLVPLSDLLYYGCGDTDANFRLLDPLLTPVEQDEKLWAHYRHISIPGINAFSNIEQRGMMIDEDALLDLEAELVESQEEARQSLMRQIPKSIKREHVGANKDIRKALSFTRKAFLIDILFKHPDGFRLKPTVWTKSTKNLKDDLKVPSTSTKDHLPYFFDSCPFTYELTEYIKADRVLTANIQSFMEKYITKVGDDSFIFPTYQLWTAVTGRCLTADAKIVTNRGVMAMREIREYWCSRKNPANGALKVLTHTNRLRNITDFVENGRKRVYEVTLSNGSSVKATSNHPFYTPNGWVPVSGLSVGDSVYVPLHDFYHKEEQEEWLVLEENNDYEVSSLGRVRYLGHRTAKPRAVFPYKKGEYGHIQVAIGRGNYRPVHRLVARTFFGEPPEGCEVCHLNGLPADNRVSNLCYGDSYTNSSHTIRHGRSRRGGSHEDCIYSDALVAEIRRRANEGVTGYALAKEYGINKNYVYSIIRGERRPKPIEFLSAKTVISIKYAGIEPTYDISVDRDHSFIANGIIVHNTSSRDPNGQNIPKRGKVAKAYRRIFIAPDGYAILEADLSQAELRISADIANDRTMLAVYNSGGDIHRSTALIVMGVTEAEFNRLPKEEQGLARFKAKAVNFGFCHLYTDKVLCLRGGQSTQVEIHEILDSDLVWDGTGWVEHEGKIYQGERECMWYDGYAGTPDHKCFISDTEKVPLEEAAKRGIPLLRTGEGSRAISKEEWALAGEKESEESRWKEFGILDRLPYLRRMALAVKTAFAEIWMPLSWNGEMDKRPEKAHVGVALRFHGPEMREMDTQRFNGLQGAGNKDRISYTRFFYQMGAGYLARSGFQRSGVRQDRQRWPLFSGESSFGYAETEQAQHEKTVISSYFSRAGNVFGRFRTTVFSVCGKKNVPSPEERGTNGVRGYRQSHTIIAESHRKMGRDLGTNAGSTTGSSTHGTTEARCKLSRRVADYFRVQTANFLRLRESIHSAVMYLHERGGYSSTLSSLIVLLRKFWLGDAGVSPTGRVWMNLGVHPTYDLVNAGPHHRFTVEDKLVSNCYGMGWRKFIGYAKTQYGVEFTDEEAEAIRSRFFAKYHALPDWHKRMRRLAHKNGYVRSYSGRIRHLPMIYSDDEGIVAEAERQAINSPVQEFASSLGVMSMGRLDQEIDPEYLAIQGFVHDAIYARVPLEYLEWGAKTLKYYMESNDVYGAFGKRMKCPIIADVGFGLNGAEVYEMDNLSLDAPYDFYEEIENLDIDLPEQLTPPNDGRIDTPDYMKIYV